MAGRTHYGIPVSPIFEGEATKRGHALNGTVLMAWIAARAAPGGRAAKVHRTYHVPISNTATGLRALAAGDGVTKAA